MIASILFYAALIVIVWVYIAYPALLALGLFGHRESIAPRPSQTSAAPTPLVSIIVAAHNEESHIEEKLKNLLASDYPSDRLEILVGSDGSSDRTEEIVRHFPPHIVGLISFPQQQGKSAMQNRLVAAASGEILVFTDADSFLAPFALRLLIENFASDEIGLATAHPRYLRDTDSSIAESESLYFRFEGWLRAQESSHGLLAMASGPLFAIRRALWQTLDPNQGDDFILPLRVAEARFRNVLDPRVQVAMALAQDRADTLFAMKVRIVSKDLRGLLAHHHLLNPQRYGALAISLWSHKLLRWLIPYFLITLFIANIFLAVSTGIAGQSLFLVTLAAQADFYAAALVGFALRNRQIPSLLTIPFAFSLVNAAALVGTLKYFSGKTSGQWKPVRKHSPAA